MIMPHCLLRPIAGAFNWFGLLIQTLLIFLVMTLTVVQPAKAAGLLIADGGFGGVLEIKDHDVNVTVNNGIAVTHVTQVFHKH